MDNNLFSSTRFKKRRFLLALAVIILLVLLGSLVGVKKIFGDKDELPAITLKEGDYLVYRVSHYQQKDQLIFYDLATDTHVPILSDWDTSDLSLSPTGRLAFSAPYENGRAIYVLDYPFTANAPVTITSDVSTQYYRMAWSPDDRYLAYVPAQDDVTTLSIWDGKSNSPIRHSPGLIGELAWSSDNRLAFTDFHNFNSDDEDRSDIFIWDGNTTVNLTQNPTGEDRFPVWNENGQIAFLSEQKGEHDIFLWDGVSTIDGLPDASTFHNIAPYLTGYISRPVWTNTSSLTFEAIRTGDTHVPNYEWDGISATNISQNPGFHNGGQRWRSDGYWSFSTYFSGEYLVHIRDEKNKTRFISEGYGVRWSDSGYFIFCHRTVTGSRWSFSMWEFPQIIKEYSGWTLSMWNGRQVIELVQGSEIDAIWANGEGVFCSSG